MGKVFRQVVMLWLAVDFTEVERGRQPPPYVDHDRVNFSEMGQFIAEHFRCGETVRIRVPNDTIDQVTLHFREQTGREDLFRLDDFSQAFFQKGIGAKPVVDVREAWRPLHHLKDRTHAPPPSVLMFIVEGSFEAVQMWIMQAGMRLGIRSAHPMAMMMSGREETPEDHQGKLPRELAQKLEEWFGVAYQPHCQLHHTVASSEMPEWVQRAQQEQQPHR